LTKNSQPFGKNFQKTLGGIFFDSHCRLTLWCGAVTLDLCFFERPRQLYLFSVSMQLILIKLNKCLKFVRGAESMRRTARILHSRGQTWLYFNDKCFQLMSYVGLAGMAAGLVNDAESVPTGSEWIWHCYSRPRHTSSSIAWLDEMWPCPRPIHKLVAGTEGCSSVWTPAAHLHNHNYTD